MKTLDYFMMILGIIIIVGFFGLLGILIFKSIKPENENLLNIAIGGLMSSFVTIVGYFFGSSQGSKIKTEMLQKDNNTLQQNNVVDREALG